MELSKGKLLNIYERMLSIRNFDLKVNQLVKRGMVPGMTHLSVGEEAANVGAIAALNADDLITSNHRGHGQVIAKGIDLNGMMAEIMGKATGTCKGKGGSMHIADLESGNLGANGIVGGGHGMAVGAAYTQKVKNTGKIVVCFFGDGATNEGSFHEAYRWFGHSSSDPGKYRTKEEVDGWKLKDPNLKFRNYLLENNIATEEELVELEQKSKKQIEDAVEFAKNSPEPTLESAFEDIFAN